jgi:hypothetical protein
VLGFSLVTSEVEKSNFYEDLEGVGELDVPSKKEQRVKYQKITACMISQEHQLHLFKKIFANSSSICLTSNSFNSLNSFNLARLES